MDQLDTYLAFENSLKEKYPEMYENVYCGISVHAGWFKIVNELSANIYNHYKHRINQRSRLLESNPYNLPVPEETEFPKVAQIKEKFGGLRFYLDGGNEYTQGVIDMAESWAGQTCETCGAPGQRRSGGWIRTLCDEHETEYQRNKNANS